MVQHESEGMMDDRHICLRSNELAPALIYTLLPTVLLEVRSITLLNPGLWGNCYPRVLLLQSSSNQMCPLF